MSSHSIRLVSVLLLSAFVFGCHNHEGTGAEQSRSEAKTLTATIGYPEPHTMFAPGGGGGGPAFTGSKVLERLARYNRDNTFSPVLATGWLIAPDAKSITIDLQQGVKWHDGQDFTADDVAYSIQEYWKPFSPGSILDFLQAVRVTSPSQVVVEFNRPVPEFSLLNTLAGATNYVLPKHLYAGTDILLNQHDAAPVGTGPWVFSKWVRGSHAEFVRNPHYWRAGEPKLDRLIVRWWRGAESRSAALETGAVDIGVSDPVPLSDLKRLQANAKLKVEFDEQGIAVGLHFNTRVPIYSDPRVRRALLYAINRQFISDTIYYGFAKPADNPILPSNKLYYTPDVPQYPYDPAKAAALLNEAGYPVKADGKRFKMNLLASGWSDENGKVGAYLKQVFDDLHIDTTLRVPDRPNSLKALYTDYDFDVAYSQGGGSATDPIPLLSLELTKAGIAKGLIFRNASRYSSPEVEQLLQQITVETDPAKRRELIHEFAKRIGTEVPVFPLVDWPFHIVSQKTVHLDTPAEAPAGESWGAAWKD